ncbi:hypothetical protein CC80DRAFT_265616 [Byssothecium circinans]|uniref:Apple domain-containing protein n=1 Tax=Byssothecium circinans TaxID=147558 RepID=A0A6A5UIE2_9PLEO|nr:hypothetical protein CC80DRAFT_265616 [Byssothecium circinans]
MLTIAPLLTLFTALTAALPTSHLTPRAGGPAILPIPSTCTVSNPRSATPATFLPSAELQSTALLYSAYYPSPTSNKTQLAEQCLQQCYGYGNHVECKAAFWAENVVVPPGYYGSPGGQLMTACLMYSRAVTEADFTQAPKGEGTDAYTRNLACPAS